MVGQIRLSFPLPVPRLTLAAICVTVAKTAEGKGGIAETLDPPADGGSMDNLREFARRARRRTIGAASYPAVNLPSLESMEILITDSPASQREDRTVLDRAYLPAHALNARSEVVLTGERPEHRYEV